ncbi:WD40 repeat-like protein [Rhizodiscina lignyota]|uniref:WD40 repeat-like protein n=1 Tax=Rhizodiscina lignyota TaxID=1504668 RepID=A0A9P4ILY7_9PEZI|nr:WD40 repeat-like protein [Rhizodiscina lignyota]
MIDIDPFTMLPPELATLILSYLDHTSLCRASAVSKGWASLASRDNGSLWRDVFMNRFKPRNIAQAVQMGGAGIGKLDCDKEVWKTKFEARQAIERNWRTGTPNAIYFQGHTDSVYCAQFDERKIITGSRDRTIRVWDINTYECVKVIGGPAAKPVSPSVTEVALDCHPMTVHRGVNLNGTPAGDAIYHIPREYHSASVLCLRFDEEIMVTGSSDSTCIVWDLKTWEPKWRLEHHSAGVLDVCFDKRYIVSCSKDNSICVWDRNNGELVKILTGHRGPVNALQMRGSKLISASSDGVTRLWCLNEMKYIKHFNSRDRGLAAVEFSDDGKHVLAGGNDQVIHKYDAETGALVHTYSGHQGLVRSLFLDSENNRVVSGSYDQAVRVYDFTTGAGLGGAYENWTTSWILSAKSDYRRIVATSQDGRALLMDFGKGVGPYALSLLKGDN